MNDRRTDPEIEGEDLDDVTQPMQRRALSMCGQRAVVVVSADDERTRIVERLAALGFDVVAVESRLTLIAALRERCAVLIIDPSARGMAIFDLIGEVAHHPGLIVIGGERDERVFARSRRIAALLVRRPFRDEDLGDLAVDLALRADVPTRGVR